MEGKGCREKRQLREREKKSTIEKGELCPPHRKVPYISPYAVNRGLWHPWLQYRVHLGFTKGTPKWAKVT